MTKIYGFFESSHGHISIRKDGTIIKKESDLSDWLLTIKKVDTEELRNYYLLNGFKHISDDGDILDIGYWSNDGKYHKPCFDWRVSTFHNTDFNKKQIKEAILKSKRWIKENR